MIKPVDTDLEKLKDVLYFEYDTDGILDLLGIEPDQLLDILTPQITRPGMREWLVEHFENRGFLDDDS